MRERTYGTITHVDNFWEIEAEPHVVLRIKRVFQRINKGSHGSVRLADTQDICRDLLWFMQRYPLRSSAEDLALLEECARAHIERLQWLEDILDPNYEPADIDLAIALRDYQRRAVELYLANGYLLLSDDVGLGKTAVGIGSFADERTLPAVVVTLTHLPKQWEQEINRFAPDLHTHVVKKSRAYQLPEWFGRSPDVVILNYAKMSLGDWPQVLARYAKSVVFDEIQELRRDASLKWQGAKHMAESADFCLGLSATPVYNYGGEFFNIAEVLKPDILGTRDEFLREWCVRCSDKGEVQDPRAFGTYLRDTGLMLRRTRKDVGRELPGLTRIPHTVESDARVLLEMKETATELARIILERSTHTKQERFTASGQFDMVMRQATGLAKAPYVAEFVRMLVEQGEAVVVFGWHRDVYDVWAEKLKDLNPVWFTGSETAAQKEKTKQAFVAGESKVLFMSLRSGAGIDGLQDVCRTVVFGELDWSPGVHEQCVGRIYRDGQPEPVMAYFLIADDGADPFIADVLGLKRQQIEGIRTPEGDLAERVSGRSKQLHELAAAYLGQQTARAATG